MNLKQDSSEQVAYDVPETPVYIRKGKLSFFPGYIAPSHWHGDVELIAVLSGEMSYNVNGHIYKLQEGEGIFINSRQLHYGFSPQNEECEFICVLLHPILLCANTYLERLFVLPVVENTGLPCQLLSPRISWQKEIIEIICGMYDVCGEAEKDLCVQSGFYRIWSLLYRHAQQEKHREGKGSSQLSSLKDMVGYIQQHYTEKITLEEIAASGKICKSTCCMLFHTYLQKTPIRYLTDYRLYKSLALLRTSDKTVTEISFAVGFCSASYFTETFRKWVGCTPTEFRKTDGYGKRI